MIRPIDMLLWCLFIITMLPATNAEVFLIQLQPEKVNTRSFNFQLNRHKSRPPIKSSQQLLQNLLGLLTPNFSEKSKNKCMRLFGSIYGTKAQRQECLDKLKNKQTKIKLDDFNSYRPDFDSVSYDDLVYFDSDSFLDFTRHNKQSIDFSMEDDSKLSDYILKPYESRTKYTLGNSKPVPFEQRELPNYYDRKWKPDDAKSKYLSYRKSYAKRNMNVETSEESSSSGTDESDEKQKDSDEEKPKRYVSNEKQKKSDEEKPKRYESNEKQEDSDEEKPKRFEVIGNGKKNRLKKASKPKYVDTSGSMEGGSIETEKPKRVQSARYPKPLQNKMIIKKKQKPETNAKKKKKQAKEFYLQSNRIVDADSDDDEFRRKLETFLPKRYHWDADEVHNLGYYWFNGPQGRYPHYALRP